MAARILITGTPGNVGTEIVRTLKGRNVPFRVAANNADTTQHILGAEVEISPFDFLKPETFAEAFAGIERLFLIRPPALANVKCDIAPAVHAAVEAGVQHIVFLSLQGVEKNRIVPHHKIEQLIISTGVTYTFLRASFFMQNLSTTHLAEIRDRGEIAVPAGHSKTSFIDVRDIAAVAASALTESGHENRKYTLTGAEALDYYQVAKRLSAVLQRSITYTNPSPMRFWKHQRAAGQSLSYATVVTGLYLITRFGNASEVSSDLPAILRRAPISFEQFANDYRACWSMVE